jgi:cardiolipin synthase (CMP-forming)
MKAKAEIFYISNLITLSRFVLLAFILFFLINNQFIVSSIFIIGIWLSDLIDGYVARKRDEVSDLGKVLDPIADKVSIFCICIVLLLKGLLPFWFIAIIIVRDILIVCGGFYLKRRRNVIVQSNTIGKFSVFLIGFTLLFIIISAGLGSRFPYSEYSVIWELISNVLIFISLVMVTISLFSYSKRFLEFK